MLLAVGPLELPPRKTVRAARTVVAVNRSLMVDEGGLLAMMLRRKKRRGEKEEEKREK